MLGDNRDRFRTPRWVKANLVIVRESPIGAIECRTCGLSALTQRELADVLGVSLSSLSSFIHGRIVRPDIAARIRGGVFEVRVRTQHAPTTNS